MSVIAELRISARDFELGRALEMVSGTSIELETMVPSGERAVPFFRVYDSDRELFEAGVRDHPTVENIKEVDVTNGQVLYALDWHTTEDTVFRGLKDQHAQILTATGTAAEWEFELRFPSHDALSAFQRHCKQSGIGLDLLRIYNPSKPEAGPWYGLTARQREALLLAVREGYYEIPRRCTTVELADQLGISDQAVTERLRRAIVALTSSTLLQNETD
jgi:predicted DNA binding protein